MSEAKHQSDLQNAIASAQEALQPRAEHAGTTSWFGRLFILVLLLIALQFAWSLYQEFGHWVGESAPEQVREDLRTLLQETRNEVEFYRGQYGELPMSLPNPVHARLVRYETDGDRYQLSVQMLNTELRLDDRGNLL